jgi:hypothetical protein
MFESQSLFKSISCPYYSTVTSSSSCERPHCPFKHHTQVQYEFVAANSSMPTIKVSETEEKSLPAKESLPSSTTKSLLLSLNENKNISQLPNALENLSNALQSIQDLIKHTASSVENKSDKNDPLNKTNSNESLVDKLNSISNALLKSVPSTFQSSIIQQNPTVSTSSSSETATKSSQIQKKAKINLIYNPTPINELKKLKEQAKTEKSEDNPSLKRKVNNDQMAAISKEEINEATNDHKIKKLKSSDIQEDNESEKKKCDLVSFSKLNLTQQVLKRYEMLNKQVPNQVDLNQAKLKKKNEQLNNLNSKSSNSSNSNVPQLLLDTSNSTQKVPLAMRQRYLKVIFDNVKPLYKDLKDACQNSSQEEKSIYDRAKNKTIYSNLVAILIKNLRTKQANSNFSSAHSVSKLNKDKQQQSEQTCYSHELMLSGPKASRVSYSINRIKTLEIKDLSGNG